MKLIIDIPDEMAHRFKNDGEQKHYDYHTVLKACVDAIPLDNVLNKIKVKIESELVDYVYETDGIYNSGLDKAIEIINNYKKESER